MSNGTYDFGGGLVFPQGPSSWLDTYLTTTQMAPFFPNAGAGPKITMKFKAKIFSFADVVVNNNSLTLLQISEPLQSTSSASPSNPYPYGADFFGAAINDQAPDTAPDTTTGALISSAQDGPSALLDTFTVTKPQVNLTVDLSAPASVVQGGDLNYIFNVSNLSPYPLNGVQAVFTLPAGVDYIGDLDDSTTLQAPNAVVVTIGRLAAGESRTITIPIVVGENLPAGTQLPGSALVRSGTAQPVTANQQSTYVIHFNGRWIKPGERPQVRRARVRRTPGKARGRLKGKPHRNRRSGRLSALVVHERARPLPGLSSPGRSPVPRWRHRRAWP